MPWLAFSFAILARLGPALLGEFVFLIPAVELAEDQRLLNASPPEGLTPPAGLLVVVVVLLYEGVDERLGLVILDWAELDGWIWTEV